MQGRGSSVVFDRVPEEHRAQPDHASEQDPCAQIADGHAENGTERSADEGAGGQLRPDARGVGARFVVGRGLLQGSTADPIGGPGL